MNKKYLEKFIWKGMKPKIAQYPIFGKVIYESLTSILKILEEKNKNYKLFAYVRKTEDGLDENVLHVQMHFKDEEERDNLWNQMGEVVIKNIQKEIEKVSDPQEKIEIENILCAVKSEK